MFAALDVAVTFAIMFLIAIVVYLVSLVVKYYAPNTYASISAFFDTMFGVDEDYDRRHNTGYTSRRW